MAGLVEGGRTLGISRLRPSGFRERIHLESWRNGSRRRGERARLLRVPYTSHSIRPIARPESSTIIERVSELPVSLRHQDKTEQPQTLQDFFHAPKEAGIIAKAALWYFKPRFPETTIKALEFLQVDKFLGLAIKFTRWRNKGELPENYTMAPSLSGMIRTAMLTSAFNETLHLGAVVTIAAVLPFVLSAPPLTSLGLGIPLIARGLVDLYCILGQRYTRAKLVSPINRSLAAGKQINLQKITGK